MIKKTDEQVQQMCEPLLQRFWDGKIDDFEFVVNIYRIAEQEAEKEYNQLLSKHKAMIEEIKGLKTVTIWNDVNSTYKGVHYSDIEAIVKKYSEVKNEQSE